MTFSCETYPRHDSSVWASSCVLLGFLITPDWHVLRYSSRFCRLYPCPPYLPLPMPPTCRQGRQAVKEPRKKRERIGQGLREKPCAAKMADRPCQEGAGLAGRAQLCQEALRGRSAGQTGRRSMSTDRICDSQSCKPSGALEEVSMHFQTRIAEGGL